MDGPPHPVVADVVGCDPGQRRWAAIADIHSARVFDAPTAPWHMPAMPPTARCMAVPTDIRRARAEIAYLIAESARPQRDALLAELLRYETVGVEDVDWAGFSLLGLEFGPYAEATGLRAMLDTLDELGPQVGTRVIRTPPDLSSRRCSACSRVAPDRGFGQPVYRCRHCGLKVDRDVNAARNHRRAALGEMGR